jgi:aryl-alcohol dehydrogenase-like predicted oxidoreductase
MVRSIPEAEAAAAIDAVWEQGIRYFDTAPPYGAGLSDMRLGRALAKHSRGKYVLSSTAVRLILDEVESRPRHVGEKGNFFDFGRPNRMVYDCWADGKLRSMARCYQVSTKAAALQFALTHPDSAAVIPGASRPERIPKTAPRSPPRSQATSGTNYVSKGSLPPTRHSPSTDHSI